MKKVISFSFVLSALMLSAAALATEANTSMDNNTSNTTTMNNTQTQTTETTAATEWTGRLYDIMPRNSKVTADWCKSHVPDTYKTSSKEANKEITGANGVMAKNVSHNKTQLGGIYQVKGTATFSGNEEGKEWKKKVNFYAYSLEKDGIERGAWYTDDCKGFYEVGPA